MKNLKKSLETHGFLCNEWTLLFRLTKDDRKTYEKNKKNLRNGSTNFWNVPEERLHPGQGQTVVLVLDHDEDASQVQVYAGVYKARRQHEDGTKTLLTQEPFTLIENASAAGIAAYVGKSPNSGVIYPFGHDGKAKRKNSDKKVPKLAKPAHDLTEKDASDIQYLQAAQTKTMRQQHNDMTNRLIALWPETEFGVKQGARYDALLKNYNARGDDLLLEVKSVSEAAHIRMAIGQLYSYWHAAFAGRAPHVAVLLPSKPDAAMVSLLKWLKIGLLWFDKDQLHTMDARLKRIATVVQ